MALSKSETDGLLALAAKKMLRGDKRTDALAGTIHAPTASRLLAKGFASKHGLDGKNIGYCITKEGRAELPGAETLAAVKTPEPVQPDRAPKVLIPAAELPKSDRTRAALAPSWNPKPGKVSVTAVAGPVIFAHLGDDPKPTPKAGRNGAPPSDVDAPSVVQTALKAPLSEPPLLAPPKPASSEPVAKFQAKVSNANAFEALCETGSIVVELSDGRARVNAVGTRGTGFEFWIMRGKAVGWARYLLGNAITELEGAKVVSTDPMPGKLPFAPIPKNERQAIA